jgi:hypothetical protein
VDALLILLAIAWIVAVGVAFARAGVAAFRVSRTAQAGGRARLEALIALDRQRDRLTQRQASMLSSLALAHETVAGAGRGVRVLAILREAVREAAGRP